MVIEVDSRGTQSADDDGVRLHTLSSLGDCANNFGRLLGSARNADNNTLK